MIVVDTSVWIDLLAGRPSPAAARCEELIRAGEPVALTDIVYTELLQGLRDDAQAAKLVTYLEAFPILRLDALDDHRLAARLFRQARSHGVTIRRTLDCLIAAPCVRTGAPILHQDQDFDRLAACTDLRVFPV